MLVPRKKRSKLKKATRPKPKPATKDDVLKKEASEVKRKAVIEELKQHATKRRLERTELEKKDQAERMFDAHVADCTQHRCTVTGNKLDPQAHISVCKRKAQELELSICKRKAQELERDNQQEKLKQQTRTLATRPTNSAAVAAASLPQKSEKKERESVSNFVNMMCNLLDV